MPSFGRAATWLSKHPKTVIGTAAVAGIMASRPIHNSGAIPAFFESTTGDPNAPGVIMKAQLRRALWNATASPTEKRAFEYLSRTYIRTPRPSLYAPGGGPGPSGNIVLGMHNLRVK